MLGNVIDRLRSGEGVSDEEFDYLYPSWARRLSGRHWTPLRVARRAAEMLVRGPEARILDVGSGVGKFCIVGAALTQGEFLGVEQRGPLVAAARAAARAAAGGLARCAFIHANMTSLDWGEFDGFYLYNPFAEHLREVDAIDETIELSGNVRERYLDFVVARLEEARPETRVITYHGFGGEMPAGWRLQAQERCGTGVLDLWVKGASGELV